MSRKNIKFESNNEEQNKDDAQGFKAFKDIILEVYGVGDVENY